MFPGYRHGVTQARNHRRAPRAIAGSRKAQIGRPSQTVARPLCGQPVPAPRLPCSRSPRAALPSSLARQESSGRGRGCESQIPCRHGRGTERRCQSTNPRRRTVPGDARCWRPRVGDQLAPFLFEDPGGMPRRATQRLRNRFTTLEVCAYERWGSASDPDLTNGRTDEPTGGADHQFVDRNAGALSAVM
jgi:hypothetical protein